MEENHPENRNYKFRSIPEFIWRQKDLDLREKLTLLALWSSAENSREINISPGKLARMTSQKTEDLEEILPDLEVKGWLELIDFSTRRRIKVTLMPPRGKPPVDLETSHDSSEHQASSENPADRLASIWNNELPEHPLTPAKYSHLQGYLKRDMDPGLIEKLIFIASERAEGSPFAYLRSILNNLYSKNITTLEEYQQERREETRHGGQVPRNNSKKEAQDKLHDVEELRKRDWN